MYTVSKGPSKIVAKTRRGLSQNYDKFDNIKTIGKKSNQTIAGNSENFNIPRPIFQTSKRATVHYKNSTGAEEETLSPQHEEIVNYINESWNMIVARNPYDSPLSPDSKQASASSDSNCSSISSSPVTTQPSTSSPTFYYIEPPSPALNDFKPFDLESWWGRRLFNNITKSL